MFDLSKTVTIIAGGLGLIGRSFVDAVLNFNGNVVIADLLVKEDNEFLDNIKKKYEKSQIMACSLDITDKESLQKLISTTLDNFGRIDAFVNTTYPRNKHYGKPLKDIEYEDFCQNVNLHLGGYFLATQQLSFFFQKQNHGKIINIASIFGAFAPKFDTYKDIYINGREMSMPVEYSAIKSGIIHITKYFAKYFKNYNIQMNCISPGGILDKQPQEFQARYKKYCINKGMLDPEDLTGLLVYLLSSNSKYLNGQNIIIDDGWSL